MIDMVCIIVVRDRCAVDPGVTGGSDRNHAAVAEVKASRAHATQLSIAITVAYKHSLACSEQCEVELCQS